MNITQAILDELTAKAKESPRLRMNLDLRNGENDTSQRMLKCDRAWVGCAYPSSSEYFGNGSMPAREVGGGVL